MTSVVSPGRPSFTLTGTLQPPTVPLAYRAGFLLVAVAMVVLPLLYLCVVAGAASAVVWWATHPAWLTKAGTNQLTLLLYVAPIMAGAILVFFMVKPIVAKPARRHDPVPLTPADQPDLFEFIAAICAQVRAPVPRVVQVDCQVNASASFMPVRFGVLQRGLVLTIGLPLVAGLSVRQFGGVLAHEFGHFAQGSGMRVTALVRRINYWFARVVFERDHWDAKLDGWSRHNDWRALIIVNLARAAIGVSRLVLKGLMKVGHAVSSFLLRQMEYDADRYEIQLAGSVAFVQTMGRLRELNLAASCAYGDLARGCEQNVLPADFPRFIINQEGVVTEEMRIASAAPTRTAWWHSHPCDRDRTRAAEIAATPGVLVGGEAPATSLFQNLDTLSAAASQHHYSHDLHLDLSSVKLIHGSLFIEERDQRDALVRAREEYFGSCVSGSRPLSVPWKDLMQWDDVRLHETMRLPRPAGTINAEQITNHYRAFERFAHRRIGAVAAEEFVAAGGRIEHARGDTDLAESSVDSARSTQAWATASQQEHATALDRFEEAVVRRLACGVVLASRADPQTDAISYATSLNIVASCMPDVIEVFELLYVIQRLGGVFEHNRPLPRLLERMQAMGARVPAILTRVEKRLADTPCPAMLTSEPLSIRAWSGLDGTRGNLDSAVIVNRMFAVYWHLLSQVVVVAIRIEGPTQSTV